MCPSSKGDNPWLSSISSKSLTVAAHKDPRQCIFHPPLCPASSPHPRSVCDSTHSCVNLCRGATSFLAHLTESQVGLCHCLLVQCPAPAGNISSSDTTGPVKLVHTNDATWFCFESDFEKSIYCHYSAILLTPIVMKCGICSVPVFVISWYNSLTFIWPSFDLCTSTILYLKLLMAMTQQLMTYVVFFSLLCDWTPMSCFRVVFQNCKFWHFLPYCYIFSKCLFGCLNLFTRLRVLNIGLYISLLGDIIHQYAYAHLPIINLTSDKYR